MSVLEGKADLPVGKSRLLSLTRTGRCRPYPSARLDPGCVKTHKSLSSPELFSQLPASDGSCQCNLISTATKSRWKFYTKVRHRSFHTAWTQSGHGLGRGAGDPKPA